MHIEEAQKRVDQWIKKNGVRYFSELTNMAVLTEEVGELARATDCKRRKAFIIRELFAIGLMFHMPYYQTNRKV
jgi:NTP pyrophosphatase (non-canonical NTP hydrolase)